MSDIRTTMNVETVPTLLQQALGSRWSELPDAVKDTHLVGEVLELQGRGSVKRGDSWIAQTVSWVFRFPESNGDVAVSVLKRKIANGEVWDRDFNGHQFQSTLTLPSDTTSSGCIRERFGLLDFEIALDVSDNRMNMPVNKAWMLGIPIPKALLPVSKTCEYEQAGKMHFDVRLELPFSWGLLVHYKGHLSSVDKRVV